MSAADLIRSREPTHGNWHRTSRIAQKLKSFIDDEIISAGGSSDRFSFAQREALDMILAKIARIVSGDPNHADHWKDIAGYALLALANSASEVPERRP